MVPSISTLPSDFVLLFSSLYLLLEFFWSQEGVCFGSRILGLWVIW